MTMGLKIDTLPILPASVPIHFTPLLGTFDIDSDVAVEGSYPSIS